MIKAPNIPKVSRFSYCLSILRIAKALSCAALSNSKHTATCNG